MPFIVYVFKSDIAIPHMEVLPQRERDAARDHAFQIMRQHHRVVGAELWEDEKLVERLRYQAPPITGRRDRSRSAPTLEL